jgi:ribosome-interacting GTPase 1
MATIEEQIKALEEEILGTQKNKSTEHHLGRLKAKIAKLKAQQELQRAKSGATGKRFYIKKSGDATVAIVGFPSVGKSSLLNYLTGSRSEVGDYNFTTLEVIPGVMEYRGARIQILDMPGLIHGASRDKGMGKEVLTAARADPSSPSAWLQKCLELMLQNSLYPFEWFHLLLKDPPGSDVMNVAS